MHRYSRALSWVATLTSAIVLIVSGAAYGYISYLNSKITHFGSLCVRNCGTPAGEVAGQNFLLVGVDSRAGANGTGVNANLKDATTGGERSDTTLLVHIGGGGGRVDALSFPRDTLMTVPAYTTPTGAVIPAHQAKFNAAFAEGTDADPQHGGGPQLLTAMIKDSFRLQVDHYVQVDFAGFQNIVKALGGVTVCLTHATYDPVGTGFRDSAGIHKLDAVRALQFVRQRDGLPGGDLDRINRQQRFLAAILRETLSAGTLTNPAKLNNVLTSALSSLKLDNGTNLDDLETLGKKLKGLSSGGVHFFTLPTGGGFTDGGLGSVLPIDSAKAQPLLQAFHDDEDPTKISTPRKAAAKTTPPVVAAALSTVHVTSINNGSGVRGASAAAETKLRARGVTVDAIATAARATATTISYGSGAEAQARALLPLFPGSSIVADAQATTGTVHVTLGAAASAGPTTTSTTSTGPVSSAAAASPSAARKSSVTNFATNGTLCGP
jgi:LCP family protein required for cell wall assembly